MTYIYRRALAQESLPRGHEIYIVVDLSFVVVTIYSICVIYAK